MARTEFEMLFQLQAQLGGAFNSSFAKAQQQVAAMQKQVQSLSKTQSDISSYQKQQAALAATKQKYEMLQQQADNLQKEFEETEGFSASLANQLLAKQQQIDKTSVSIQKQEASLEELGSSLKEAGVDTENLKNESSRLATEMDELKEKQEEAAEAAIKMGSSGTQAIMAYQESIVASRIQESLQKLWEETQACAEASIEFESAITGVYKTVDGTDQQLAAISDEIKELSTRIPATTEEIAAVAEAAGQLGIATNDVMAFTGVMIDLGESTNLTAEEAATSLAKFTNITGTVSSEYSRLGSVIVDLGNNFATTEADIVAMSTRLASAGKLAGLSEPEIMALAAAMSSVGIEAEAGGTAMTQTFSAIEDAVAHGGENLQSFARIAGMSAEEFASSWENNPIQAIQAFISGIGELDQRGESAVLVLDELGLSGIRQSNMLKSLGLAADTLGGAVATANTAWDENIALTEEASKRYATTASQQAMMQNAFNNLRIAVGDNYTPALRDLYGVTTDVVSGMAEFVEANPALVKAVTAAVGVIGVATAGITAYSAAVKLGQAATALFTSTIGAAALGPIAAGIAGVAALTAVFVGLSSATDEETAAVRQMTETSRADYYQIQQLESEYKQVCSTYGETSNEAMYLAWQIEGLSTSFESNKQSLSAYIAECDAANESLSSMLDSNRKTFTEIGNNSGTTTALVDRLKDLSSQTELTVASEEEMKAIIAELNQQFPELAFSYKAGAAGVMDYAAAVGEAAGAQERLQKYEQAQKGATDALVAKDAAYESVTKALEMQAAARERLTAAEKAYNDYVRNNSTSGADMALFGATFSDEYDELLAAQEAYASYTAQVEESQSIFDQAVADHQMYTEALAEYVGSTDEASNSSAAFNEVISSTMEKVQALCAAYTEAYNAALESVQGQYDIWDKASQVVAIGTDTITSALSSQTAYWQDYNSNLQNLSGRTVDIKGLSDMLSNFVDGSEESVNAVAGMASATDEELKDMVAAWQELQEEHDLVAQSIAELKTNFTAEMDSLVAAVAQDIRNMNMSSQATAAAKATINAYIKVAEDMLDEVEAAYKKVADTAAAALGNASSTHSGEGGGFATGTRSAEPGFHYVGENGPELLFFNGGEKVLTAHETATVRDRMQAETQVSSYSNTMVETETTHSSTPTYIQVTFQIEGNATPEVVETLDLYGEEFAERVLSVIEGASTDAARRSY